MVGDMGEAREVKRTLHLPQHFLYFMPLPQGQGTFLPTLAGARCGACAAMRDPRAHFDRTTLIGPLEQ
jgi:hypothetical protein